MKKLLLVALVAAMVAGTAEAGRRGCRTACRPKCEVVEECAPKCETRANYCIKPGRCRECTFSKSCTEEDKPEFCYLVPAPFDYKKHTDVVTTITYECADMPCCAVRPTQDQVNQLRNDGAIPSSCN